MTHSALRLVNADGSRELVTAALGGLSQYDQLLIARRIEGETYQEIAEAAGLSTPSDAYYALLRAGKRLQGRITFERLIASCV